MAVNKAPARRRYHDKALRQWCVEQAIRWPQVLQNPSPGLGQQYQVYSAGGYVDADVIGRAEKLLAWVSR